MNRVKLMATFEKTISITAYAEANGLSSMELIENPKNGKIFAKDSKGCTYRVSDKVTELSGDLAISWFTPEDGEASYMIHPQGQSNVVSTLNFGKTPVASVKKPLGQL